VFRSPTQRVGSNGSGYACGKAGHIVKMIDLINASSVMHVEMMVTWQGFVWRKGKHVVCVTCDRLSGLV